MARVPTLLGELSAWIARVIYPRVFEREEQLLHNLEEIKARLGYEFPTVRVTVDWVLAHDPEASTPDDPRPWFENEYRGVEPAELGNRLRESLPDA